MNIAYWNIHSLNEGKMEDDLFISSICKYDIVCLSETMLSESPGNLPGFSSPFIVKPIRNKRKGRASGGILIYTKPNYQKGISEIKQNNFSIWLKLDKNYFKSNVNMFICFIYIKPYTSKEISESIFTQLENDIASYSTQGEVMVCGDFNARTGGLSDYILNDAVTENFEDCPTPPGYCPDYPIKRNQLDSKSNFHGSLLTDLCKSSQLRIVNGRFLGDSLGYFTFFNMNGKSTVDYTIVTQSLLHNIRNFVVNPPTYLSDHCLISIHFKCFSPSICDKEYENDVLFLPGSYIWSDQNKDLFVDSLLEQNNLADILSLNNLIEDEKFTDIDYLVQKTNEIYLQAANNSVKFKLCNVKSRLRRKKAVPKKVWMSNDGLLLRKELRTLSNRLAKNPNNNALRLTFCNCRREFNKLKNKLKKDFFNNIIQEIDSVNPKNCKEFWNRINKYKKRDNLTDSIIPPSDWEDHFKKLLTTDENFECKLCPEMSSVNNCNLDIPFTCKEIKDGIKTLKSGKTPGIDLILNEFIKAGANTLALTISKLFNKILNTGHFPKTWNLSLLTSIYKSGDPADCGNYRGISISSCFGKLFTSLLQKRISDYLESNQILSANQGGFRKGYRTVDHIFILKTIINKYVHKCNKKLYICFIDFKKAFDSVWRSALFLKLRGKGITGKVYNIIHDLYLNTQYSYKTSQFYTKPFMANQGVKQGDSLSPTLFNIFVDDIGKYFDKNSTDPVNLQNQYLNHLLYADDLMLISETPIGLQHCIDSVQKYCSDWRLTVNLNKTKIMVFSKKNIDKKTLNFYYGPTRIEIVESYKYLGVIFSWNGKFKESVSNLSDKARKAYFALKSKLPYNNNLSVKSWLKLYNSMIVPIITYGSEIWISDFKPNFDSLDKTKLEKTQNMILKNILGIHSKASNMAVRCELGTLPIYMKCYSLMFGYYSRLNDIGEQADGPHRILKAAFETDKTFTEKENSWHKRLLEVCKKSNISSLNISKHLFKSKLQEFYISKIKFEFNKIKEESSGKLAFYSKIFTKFELQDYLSFNIPKELRNKLTKLRLSAHALAIETGRYSKPKIPKNERFCKFCLNEIENETHFLFQCPHYNSLRIKFEIVQNICNITDALLIETLNPNSIKKVRNLCSFIKEAFEERAHPTVHI